jgi:hypothetical protein
MKAAVDWCGPFVDVRLEMKEMGLSQLVEQLRLARGKLGALLESLESTDLDARSLRLVRERCDYLNAEIDEFADLLHESLRSIQPKK